MEILNPRVGPRALAGSRPTAIAVICVVGIIGALFPIPLIFTNWAGSVGVPFQLFLALRSIVPIVCMVGLWQMRRWALITYTAFVVLVQVGLLAFGMWGAIQFLIGAVVIAVGFKNLCKLQ
jgi:hypothetical protein